MSRFLQEIHELPRALKDLAACYRGEGRELLSRWAALAAERRAMLFSGMGTSEFAPLAVLGRMAALGYRCRTVDAGEWLHYGVGLETAGPEGPAAGRELPVLISQSGESVEVKRLVEQGRTGDRWVALTNQAASTLGRSAELTLPLCAGDEASISTKTYANTLALLYLMTSRLRGERAGEEAAAEIESLAEVMLEVDEERIAAAALFLRPAGSLVFVGRGPALVCARQCALTFMEGAHCVGSAFSGGAFRHGPMEAIDVGFRLVLFAPRGKTSALLGGLAGEAAALGARVLILSDGDFEESDSVRLIRVPNLPGTQAEDLFPLAASAAHNLLLHHFAAAGGVRAGIFHYGHKVTSRE